MQYPLRLTLMRPTTAISLSPQSINEVRTDGDCANNYTLTRYWNATDDCNNTASCVQVITVQDTQAPVFDQECPEDLTVECNAVPAPADLNATDNCDLNITVEYNEVRTDGDCANNYTLTRYWNATDDCNNTASCVQVITVQDTQAPVFDRECPADLTVECDAVPAPADLNATDNCDLNITVEYNEVRTDGDCANNYTLTRYWNATDDCNNTASCVQVITVQDTQAPVFDRECPADLTVECDAVPAPADLNATDNCDLNITVEYNEVRTDGDCANNYTLTRYWNATDDCNNTASCVQVITVQDTQAPVSLIENAPKT